LAFDTLSAWFAGPGLTSVASPRLDPPRTSANGSALRDAWRERFACWHVAR
jgi:hypothetical protein